MPLCRVPKKTLGKDAFCRVPKNGTRQNTSLPSARKKALSKDAFCRVPKKNTRQSYLCRVPKKTLGKAVFAECPIKYTWQSFRHSAKCRFPVVNSATSHSILWAQPWRAGDCWCVGMVRKGICPLLTYDSVHFGWEHRLHAPCMWACTWLQHTLLHVTTDCYMWKRSLHVSVITKNKEKLTKQSQCSKKRIFFIGQIIWIPRTKRKVYVLANKMLEQGRLDRDIYSICYEI